MSDLNVHTEMPVQEFLALGLRDFAYVKSTAVADGETTRTIFEIHTADGASVGAAPSRELAFAAVLQNGLQPVSAH
ncbi:MAG TPA: DUF1150 family protein [Alphaproteobacteria bacterium]